MPTASGRACCTEVQNASMVWPLSVRPDLSVMVTDEHHRHAPLALDEHLVDREEARLQVERVEDRLGQDEIDAAVEQAAHLLGVGGAQLVEGDGAERRVVDLRRDRQRAIGRADRAGDEARPPVFCVDASAASRAMRAAATLRS